MRILDGYREAFRWLPAGALAAEAVAETEMELTVSLENGKQSGSAASDVTSLFVRVQGEGEGFAFTQSLEEAPAAVLERAYENSRWSGAAGVPIRAADAYAFEEKEPECTLTEFSLLGERAQETDRWLTEQFPKLSLRRLELTDRVRTVAAADSAGKDCQTSSHSFCAALTAADPGFLGLFFHEEQTFPSLEAVSPQAWGRRLERWYWTAEAQQAAVEDFRPGMYQCVLDGRVVSNILLTAWRMFTAGNYQKKTTPLAGKGNQPVGSPALNLTDRAVRSGSGYVFRADCEGNRGRDAALVTDGILTGLIGCRGECDALGKGAAVESSYAQEISCTPAGNGGRRDMISGNLHTDVVTIPKNFGIEPGSGSLEELLAQLGDGIYIWDSFDMFHSVNTVSGTYSIPCSGIRIRDGKPAGGIRGLTINGTVQDLLKEVLRADAEVFVLPMLMENSFTVSAPDLLIRRMNVSR